MYRVNHKSPCRHPRTSGSRYSPYLRLVVPSLTPRSRELVGSARVRENAVSRGRRAMFACSRRRKVETEHSSTLLQDTARSSIPDRVRHPRKHGRGASSARSGASPASSPRCLRIDIRPVRDIAPADRPIVERVVGQPLHEQDRLIIHLVPMLPSWCNVFAGMNDTEIDAIYAAIVRSHNTRTVEYRAPATRRSKM